MDVRESLGAYVRKMLSGIKGMKALLLDTEMTGVVSLCTTQSSILAQNVVLTQKLAAPSASASPDASLTHLKAVVFVRPTRANVDLLRQHLRQHSFGEYHLFFSNVLKLDLLQQLADADALSLVKQVQELYADYFPVNKSLFSLNLQSSLKFSTPRPRWSRNEEARYQRAVQGLCAVLLSLKLRPAQIRYQRGSDVGGNFAREVRQAMEVEKDLFSFRAQGRATTTLLIVDRREDPVTPLLTQWTYQAMVHELFCIRNNRVDLRQTASARVDAGRPASKVEQVVLSQNDSFFAQHMDANFGDLGEAIKQLLESYQKLAKSNAQISTVEDMQSFVDSYPEFKKFANNVSKHVAIMGELAHLVDSHKLLDISQLEQQLACSSDHAAHVEEVRHKVMDPAVDGNDALRLVLLYALRYESHPQNQVVKLKHMLQQQKGLGQMQIRLVDAIIEYAGEKKRAGDLYGDSSGLISKSLKMATRAVKGVSNVYTQHKPVLHETIDKILKGRLPEAAFPVLGGGPTTKATVPDNLIVFMVGGATYEEAVAVRQFNQAKGGAGTRIILGGTCIHNSTSFTTEVNELSLRHSQTPY